MSPKLPPLDLTKTITVEDFALHSARSLSSIDYENVDIEGLPMLRTSYRTPRSSSDEEEAAETFVLDKTHHSLSTSPVPLLNLDKVAVRSDDCDATRSGRTIGTRCGPFLYTPQQLIIRRPSLSIPSLGSSDIFLRRLEEAEWRDERRLAQRASATARFGSFSDSDDSDEETSLDASTRSSLGGSLAESPHGSGEGTDVVSPRKRAASKPAPFRRPRVARKMLKSQIE